MSCSVALPSDCLAIREEHPNQNSLNPDHVEKLEINCHPHGAELGVSALGVTYEC